MGGYNVVRDILELSKKKIRPSAAEGKIRIDLTDPLTGRVKERVEGKNLVFEDSLLFGESFNWVQSLSNVWMVLNDSPINIDATVPFVLGQTVGFGRPSLGSNGTRRGAYNAANQVLAAVTPTSIRWKFQYDFTSAQANGTIRNIGLTHQYGDYAKESILRYPGIAEKLSGANGLTNDGRYCYSISTDGVITVYDTYLGTTSTIDVSSVVGSTNASNKTVGYAPATGKYYIYVYNATASLRFMYRFSSNTFSSLESAYTASNITVSSANVPLYIYGDVAFWCSGDGTVSTAIIPTADFVSNTMLPNITSFFTGNATSNDGINGYYDRFVFTRGSIASPDSANGKYIYLGIGNNSSYGRNGGMILDMEARAQVGYFLAANQNSNNAPATACPIAKKFTPCGAAYMRNSNAVAAKKLDAPVTKTSAYGMTATYELEVFW